MPRSYRHKPMYGFASMQKAGGAGSVSGATFPTDTGWLDFAGSGDITNTGSGTSWGSLDNALTENAQVSSATLFATISTKELNGQDLAATPVPTGSVILGIEVRVKVSEPVGAADMSTDKIQLVVGGALTGGNRATGTTWTGSLTFQTYGSSTDMWGLPTLTAADVNAADFGFVMQATNNHGADPRLPGCDVMQMKIHYWEDYTYEDVTDKNFPALKHFLPAVDGTGTYGLRDTVGGVVHAASDWTAAGNGVTLAGGARDNVALSSGSWDIDSSLETLILWVGKFDTNAYFGIGRSGASGTEFMLGNGGALVGFQWVMSASDGNPPDTDTFGGAGVDSSVVSVVGTTVIPAGDWVGFTTDASGDHQAGDTIGETVFQSQAGTEDYSSISEQAKAPEIDMHLVMQFTSGIPANLDEAIEWLQVQCAGGNFVLPPHWYLVS